MEILRNESIKQLDGQKQDFEMRVGSVVEFNLDIFNDQQKGEKINRCMSANTTGVGNRRRQRHRSHVNVSRILQ